MIAVIGTLVYVVLPQYWLSKEVATARIRYLKQAQAILPSHALGGVGSAGRLKIHDPAFEFFDKVQASPISTINTQSVVQLAVAIAAAGAVPLGKLLLT